MNEGQDQAGGTPYADSLPGDGVHPSVLAAQRARGNARRGDTARAYPMPAATRDPEALGVELAATRALLLAESSSEVGSVVSTLVHDLGGGLVPARYADHEAVLPLDVSLGLSEPMLPFADPLSVATMRLGHVLPGCLETARLVLARLRLDAEATRDHSRGAPVAASRDRSRRSAGSEPSRAPAADYFRAVSAFDEHAASDLVVELLHEGTTVHRITQEVLAPAQVRVGELWEAGRWSVADEHAATSITEAALSALTHAGTPRRGAHARHVAVACVEGEWHSLPARMAAAVAGATGEARVTMLGPSLPADQLHRRLAAGDIDVLALSCTIPTNLVGAARCVAAAHQLGVPVVVGGSAFGDTPHRALAIGADDWAVDAEVLLGPIPALAHRDNEISQEVLELDSVDDGIISLAHDRLVGTFPRLSDRPAYQQARTREDLRWMTRCAAAALLTHDASIVDDLLARLRGLPHEMVPGSVVATSAHLLADTLAPQAPSGAAILRNAATTLETQLEDAETGESEGWRGRTSR